MDNLAQITAPAVPLPDLAAYWEAIPVSERPAWLAAAQPLVSEFPDLLTDMLDYGQPTPGWLKITAAVAQLTLSPAPS